MKKGNKTYKMVPVSPGRYSQLEDVKNALGCSSFDDLFGEIVGKKKIDGFGCWKGCDWAKEIGKDRKDSD